MQLSEIKGFGEKRIAKLREAGIHCPEDLLLYYPYDYLDLSLVPDFEKLCDGDKIVFWGKVESVSATRYIRRGLFYTKSTFSTYYDIHNIGNLSVSATFFNQRYISKQLIPGKLFYVSGKLKKFKGSYEVQGPVLTPYSGAEKLCVPLYKPFKGLPVSVLQSAIKQTLDAVKIESHIPHELADKYGLIRLDDAFRGVHLPENYLQAARAAESLAAETLANNLCIYNILKKRHLRTRTKFYNRAVLPAVEALIQNLPYRLTNGQRAALDQFLCGLHAEDKNLNALLEGDVGSGKTIVAFVLAYYAALSGYQTALMAPTEILAAQHYKNALKLFGDTGVQIGYLTSSQSPQFREENLFNIKNGIAKIVIGTHAVIQKEVTFKNLSLVIIDEQHRFGVLQRGNLENKSESADCIVMSATPIPRTLALTLYGDLEAVEIRDKPPEKAKTITRFVPKEKINDMYRYLLDKCESGEQCFIVCPRIDENEDENLPSVSEVYKKLLPLFKPQGIAALHGRLHDTEKNKIMSAFSKKEIKILISTTVIEVGIDYRDATSIVILNADRYGLSQLHQLRGRVGRGEKESYCFIASDNVAAKRRLDYFVAADNGFELAEYDFAQRGAGDFLGIRQHGAASAKITPEIIMTAKALAEELAALPQTPKHIPENPAASGYEFIKSLTLN